VLALCGAVIEAILFDIDGTLVDHEAARRAALAAQLRSTHSVLSRAEVDEAHELWAALEREHFADYLAGRVSHGEQRRRRVTGLLGVLGDGADGTIEHDRWFASYLASYEQAWAIYDDVIGALSGLAERHSTLILGVLSNGERDQQRAKLAATGIAASFSIVLTAGELGCAKPEPRIFTTACELIDRPPGAVAYVGDDLDVDARAACAAGLHGIWLDRPGEQPGAHPNTISSLQELERLVSELD
jgi:putative hydrolase of the HAD superfamily